MGYIISKIYINDYLFLKKSIWNYFHLIRCFFFIRLDKINVSYYLEHLLGIFC